MQLSEFMVALSFFVSIATDDVNYDNQKCCRDISSKFY